MNAKIEKELRNSVNRVTNCETANISKTVNASSLHIEAIKKLKKSGRFALLPEELKELAQKRQKHEELSLTQLGQLFNPPLKKSTVNNRLKKIMEFAKNKKER
jgi:DNA-binding protein WhiA